MTGTDDDSEVARITIQPHRGALIASVQVDLEERVLRRFQSDLLERIRSSQARHVIVDLTGVEVLDGTDFAALCRTIEMASLMGTATILCGVRPGVAAALVDLNVPTDRLRTSLNLDTALEELRLADSPASGANITERAGDQEPNDGAARDTALHPE